MDAEATPAAAETWVERPGGHVAPAALEVVAGALHFLSIPVSIVVLWKLVEFDLGYSAPWSSVVRELDRAGLLPAVGFGSVAQLAFAFVALTVGRRTFRVREWTWVLPIPSGAAALVVSIMVFGGPLGAAGGVLSIVAGIIGLTEPRPGSQVPPIPEQRLLPPPYPPPRF